MGERLPCTQEVIGSNPFTSTRDVTVGLSIIKLDMKDKLWVTFHLFFDNYIL